MGNPYGILSANVIVLAHCRSDAVARAKALLPPKRIRVDLLSTSAFATRRQAGVIEANVRFGSCKLGLSNVKLVGPVSDATVRDHDIDPSSGRWIGQ